MNTLKELIIQLSASEPAINTLVSSTTASLEYTCKVCKVDYADDTTEISIKVLAHSKKDNKLKSA